MITKVYVGIQFMFFRRIYRVVSIDFKRKIVFCGAKNEDVYFGTWFVDIALNRERRLSPPAGGERGIKMD